MGQDKEDADVGGWATCRGQQPKTVTATQWKGGKGRCGAGFQGVDLQGWKLIQTREIVSDESYFYYYS